MTQLTKDIVARLKREGLQVGRVWLPPTDNPAGMVTIVLAYKPAITIQIDEFTHEAFVLRYLNEREHYYYPPRRSIDDLFADLRAAIKGELYG